MSQKHCALAALLALAACGSSDKPRQAPPHPAAASDTAGAVDTTVLGAMRVRMADTLLTLAEGSRRTTVPLPDYINSSGGYRHALLDARRNARGERFLLLRTRGESRPGAPDGRCAAGQETNIVWLALDSALNVEKARSVLVGSCLQMRQPLTRRDDFAIALYASGDSVTVVTYDSIAPERGIQIATALDTTTR